MVGMAPRPAKKSTDFRVRFSSWPCGLTKFTSCCEAPVFQFWPRGVLLQTAAPLYLRAFSRQQSGQRALGGQSPQEQLSATDAAGSLSVRYDHSLRVIHQVSRGSPGGTEPPLRMAVTHCTTLTSLPSFLSCLPSLIP